MSVSIEIQGFGPNLHSSTQLEQRCSLSHGPAGRSQTTSNLLSLNLNRFNMPASDSEMPIAKVLEMHPPQLSGRSIFAIDCKNWLKIFENQGKTNGKTVIGEGPAKMCMTESPLSRPTSAQYMRYNTTVEAMQLRIGVEPCVVNDAESFLSLRSYSARSFCESFAVEQVFLYFLWTSRHHQPSMTFETDIEHKWDQFQNLGNWKPLGFQTLQLMILRSYLSLNALQGCAPTQSNNSATDPEFTTTSVLLLNQLFDSLYYMPHDKKTRSKL